MIKYLEVYKNYKKKILVFLRSVNCNTTLQHKKWYNLNPWYIKAVQCRYQYYCKESELY